MNFFYTWSFLQPGPILDEVTLGRTICFLLFHQGEADTLCSCQFTSCETSSAGPVTNNVGRSPACCVDCSVSRAFHCSVVIKFLPVGGWGIQLIDVNGLKWIGSGQHMKRTMGCPHNSNWTSRPGQELTMQAPPDQIKRQPHHHMTSYDYKPRLLALIIKRASWYYWFKIEVRNLSRHIFSLLGLEQLLAWWTSPTRPYWLAVHVSLSTFQQVQGKSYRC